VVAAHTDLIGDVAERQSKGERAALARHAPDFRQGGIRCVCDHVIGDTFETQCFPSRDLLQAYHMRLQNPGLMKHAMKLMGFMLKDLDESSADFALATSVAGIRAIAPKDKIAVVLSTQGLTPLEDEPSLLEVYHRLGIRVLGLATTPGNAAIGSYKWNPQYGLSALGRAIIVEARRLKMVIDVSAVSKPGFYDVAALVDGPFIASCSNAYGVCDYGGGLDDEQMDTLGKHGGVMALIANNQCVSTKPQPTVADYVDHIEYIAEHIGIDHVAIGPDIVEDSFYPIETYHRMFADIGFWSTTYPKGFESHRELPNVTAELLRRGYAEADIQKVLGENILRVYREVWGQ
jgi:membrane dipeptidase